MEEREGEGKVRGLGKGERGTWRERGIPALLFPHFKP